MKDDASAAEVGGRFEEADDRLPEGRGGPKPKPKPKAETEAETESRNRKPRRYLAYLVERARRIFSV